MGAPSTLIENSDARVLVDIDQHGETPPELADSLADIGAAITAVKLRDTLSAESATHVLEDRQAFLDEFREVCEAEVRPAMQAVVERLRQEGGDGMIEEHPGGEPRFGTPRMTLWMSLQGSIEGVPRPDRHPYLQLDAEVADRVVRLTEGDSWRGGEAGRSGPAGTWSPAEVTRALVVQELLRIVRRAAGLSLT